VSGINILSSENLAPVYVVEHEIVCEGPIGTKPTESCLPHVAVCINHARHENTARSVDLHRALWYDKLPTNLSDMIVNDKNIAALDHSKRGINGQHGGVTKYHRTS